MRRPTPFAVRSSTRLGQRSDLVKSESTFYLSTKAFPPRLSAAWQFNIYPQTLRSPSKPGHAHICIIGVVVGTRGSMVILHSCFLKTLNVPCYYVLSMICIRYAFTMFCNDTTLCLDMIGTKLMYMYYGLSLLVSDMDNQ
ncbi:hypothetical protein Tco_0966598 [Tanacetum coccineum]